MKPLFMQFPTQMGEVIRDLAQNDKLTSIQKGVFLCNYIQTRENPESDECSYAASVARGFIQKGAGETAQEFMDRIYPPRGNRVASPDDLEEMMQREYYSQRRFLQIAGVPTAIAENAIGASGVSSGFGYKCRDCDFVAKSDSESFEHENETARYWFRPTEVR